MDNEKILAAREKIENAIRKAIAENTTEGLELHSVRVDGKFSYVTKQLEYGIYADVREKGQIFLGMSS